MSKLRPECGNSYSPALPDETVLFLLRDSLAKRRELIYGRLRDGNGHYCAMGCLWADYPNSIVHTSLTDEVAAVNDSVPPTATPQERWKKVNSWLRLKLRVLARAKKT